MTGLLEELVTQAKSPASGTWPTPTPLLRIAAKPIIGGRNSR